MNGRRCDGRRRVVSEANGHETEIWQVWPEPGNAGLYAAERHVGHSECPTEALRNRLAGS